MSKELPLILLASASPRRKLLLEQIKLKFKLINSPAIDEKVYDGENPIHAVKRISKEKLISLNYSEKEGIILTADTIVYLNQKILGKPKNKREAILMLKELSNNSHFVYTGFVLYNIKTKKTIIEYEKTKVHFRKLSDSEILSYVDSGSPMDKAGAYGIQDDFGADFVKSISGCYYNVVGLPISKVYIKLLEII
jgi:septum formation protein